MSHYDKYFPEDLETKNFTQKAFMAMVMKAMSEVRPQASLKLIEDLTASYTDPKDGDVTMNFHNVWLSFKENSGSRFLIMRNWLSNWEKSEEDFLNSGTLVTAIRNYGEELNMDNNGVYGPAGIELAPGLQALFALDSDAGMVFIKKDHALLKDADYNKVLKEALENLRNILPPNVEVFKSSDYTWILKVDDNYESSLILFDDIMSFMEKEANEKLIFSVPTRNLLLCAHNESERIFQHLKKNTEETFHAGPYSLSPNVYSWKNGKIEVVYG
ncbi:MAG: DUF1444 family protein [Candidatus Melainabacteria bacterium]|nr:DUF1444 family protein [Candidatus Melainabacteria bacterium]